MRPLLDLLRDGQTHRMRDLTAALASQFALSPEDLTELLPSGRQATYLNRIGWAKTYLLKAGALHSPQRGLVALTPRGAEILRAHPAAIKTRDLQAFQEFREFQGLPTGAEPSNASHTMVTDPAAIDAASALSPEEDLARLYASLEKGLRAELLVYIKQLSPDQFERLVVEVIVAMGYGGSVRDAGQALGRSGDDGIDGMVKQDPLGLDRVYIQAKRWTTQNVRSPDIRTFAGSLTFHRASKGVFITASAFSEGAQKTAIQIGNIVLIDGETLARLMIDYGVGVITRETYRIRRVDIEYFEEL